MLGEELARRSEMELRLRVLAEEKKREEELAEKWVMLLLQIVICF